MHFDELVTTTSPCVACHPPAIVPCQSRYRQSHHQIPQIFQNVRIVQGPIARRTKAVEKGPTVWLLGASRKEDGRHNEHHGMVSRNSRKSVSNTRNLDAHDVPNPSSAEEHGKAQLTKCKLHFQTITLRNHQSASLSPQSSIPTFTQAVPFVCPFSTRIRYAIARRLTFLGLETSNHHEADFTRNPRVARHAQPRFACRNTFV